MGKFNIYKLHNGTEADRSVSKTSVSKMPGKLSLEETTIKKTKTIDQSRPLYTLYIEALKIFEFYISETHCAIFTDTQSFSQFIEVL